MRPDRAIEPFPAVDGSSAARATQLVGLFFEDVRLFGGIREVDSREVREPHRRLLDHRSHMTVTMEEFVGNSLGLRVLRERRDADAGSADRRGLYAREIQLLSPSGEPVQYGIVRLDLASVSPEACDRILAGSTPLGRVLIEAGTLRDVHAVSLVEITAGPELSRRLGIESGRVLYGRVATISLAAFSLVASTARSPGPGDSTALPQSPQAPRPAVELLEILLVA